MSRPHRLPRALLASLMGAAVCTACTGPSETAHADTTPIKHAEFTATPIAKFNEPWAMTFLPDGRLLVTEKKGALKLYTINGEALSISGVPEVDYGGQGGLGDVVLHPRFRENQLVYLSYAEAGPNDTRGAAVARAKLTLNERGGALENVQVIWRQAPKVTGRGHYGHRIAFGPDGFLYLSSGERQKFDPAQDMKANLGKIIRLRDDGAVPEDNPFANLGGVTAQIWSLGHRNPLGLAFDGQGRLWSHEMGPKGGDEMNIIERGANYGYPTVSNGDHYDGRTIPDHDAQSNKFKEPVVTWRTVISPSSLVIYSGNEFPDWRGDAFIGGLSSQSLVRVEFSGEKASEVQRFEMGRRIREVEQGPDGALWVLEDEREGGGGRLLRLTRPKR